MTNRYFVASPIKGGQAVLTGAEAHHLAHVMRAGPGEHVTLFDGSGAEFTARIERVARNEVDLAVLARREVDRELPLRLTLGAPLPKGDRQRWLVEKAVELGVRQLVPLTTSRSVPRPGPKALERLRRTVIEASKQCGRNRLMEIAAPRAWPDFLVATRTISHRLLAHPASDTSDPACSAAADSARDAARADSVALAVGPEGGFTRDELCLATDSGWQLIDLGPRILRIETAAILLVSLVSRHVPER